MDRRQFLMFLGMGAAAVLGISRIAQSLGRFEGEKQAKNGSGSAYGGNKSGSAARRS